MHKIVLGNRNISESGQTFVIAEIGSNHNQDLNTAKAMIGVAADCGVDAVKFQSLLYDEVWAEDEGDFRSLYEKIKLEEDWYAELKAAADAKNVIFFSAPCYLRAVELLEEVGVELYKIASPQTFAFPQIISAVAETGKPTIISTGYCDMPRIERAVGLCRAAGNGKIVVLHCVSQYPARPEQINLEVIKSLKEKLNCLIGFSDHTLGVHIPVAAAAIGACVVEKHFTLDKDMPGPDHSFAMDPAEFELMVRCIREVDIARGSNKKRVLVEEEELAKKIGAYRLVTARALKKGESLLGNLNYKRATHGILAEKEDMVVGKVLKRELGADAVVESSDLEEAS